MAIDPKYPTGKKGRKLNHERAANEHRLKGAHCWESKRDYETDETFTCLLPINHDGPHEWTPDQNVVIQFLPKKNEQ
jgi:hypothetical protein